MYKFRKKPQDFAVSSSFRFRFSNAIGVIRAGFSGFGRLDLWCRGLRRPRRGLLHDEDDFVLDDEADFVFLY